MHGRFLMKSIYILIFLSLILLSGEIQAKRKKQYFNQIEFEVDFTITHEILSANFISALGNELLVIGEDAEKRKVFALYVLDEQTKQYRQYHKIQPPESVSVFDLMTDDKGLEKVLFINPNEILTLSFENKMISPLAENPSLYLNPKPQFIAKKELVKDLNGDGLDDIFISDFKNINVFLQKNNGEFNRTTLPIKAIVNMTTEDIAFSEKPLFNVDTNFDQLKDIITLQDSKLRVFEQSKTLDFSLITSEITLPFKVSAVPWWMLRGADGKSADQSNLKHRMLEAIEDINGDGIADIMVRLTNSSGVFDRQNIYEIFYGFNSKGELSFLSKPNTSISAEGTLSGLELLDINADGRKEILVSSFDIGISQIIGALLSGSIDQDVYVFSLDKNDEFTEDPLFEEEVDLNFSLSSGSTGRPVILLADLNGDKLKELVLSSGSKRLAIYRGENSDELFKSRSKRHKLKLPENGAMISAVDLNDDAKQEILVRYGKQDPEELRHKIIVLSAK